MKNDTDTIPILKTLRAKRRKRRGITPTQIRKAVEVLRAGCNTSVKYNADPVDMANQAVANLRAAIYQAIDILKEKK